MPPVPPRRAHDPLRLVLYAQTHHAPHTQTPVSLLPLLPTPLTHLIVGAFHLNATPGHITLNDDPPSHPKFDSLWADVRALQTHPNRPKKVLAMLGGAAPGTFTRLADPDPARFEAYYAPLRDCLRARAFDGVDLDVEERVPLACPLRLLTRLRADFGPAFVVTLAPCASALLHPRAPHLSGFSYFELAAEAARLVRPAPSSGAAAAAAPPLIAWFNVQLYNGWGDARQMGAYLGAVARAGWDPRRVVLGVLTAARNG
ncbi:glycoside hydrolase superfamily, partial [Lineolata rhizophorae]